MNTASQEMSPTPLIIPVAPAGQEQRVETLLDMINQQMGFIPDGLRLYTVSPPLLETFLTNIGYFTQETHLPPLLTTMIRYLVSSNEQCSFCIDINEGILLDMGLDLDALRAAQHNSAVAPVNEAEYVLLDIALRSVTRPESIQQADMQAAHDQGWTDRDIFDAVAQAASNFTFNKILRTFNIKHQGVFA